VGEGVCFSLGDRPIPSQNGSGVTVEWGFQAVFVNYSNPDQYLSQTLAPQPFQLLQDKIITRAIVQKLFKQKGFSLSK
jgi:hypothetical protein